MIGGGTIMQMAGSIFQGMAAYGAGQQNKAAYATASVNALRQGAAQESRIRDSVRQAVGNQVAAQWGNGMEGGTGSAIDAVHESLVQGALDALNVRAEAQSRSETLNYQGALAEQQGQNSLISGLLGAGASFAQGQQDWAVARQGRVGSNSARLQSDVNATIANNRGIF